MEPALKQRVVGALVLVALAIIFVPMLVVEPQLDDVGLAPAANLSPMPAMPEPAFSERPAAAGRVALPSATDLVAELPDAPEPARLPGLKQPDLPGGLSSKVPSPSALPAPAGWVVQAASLSSRESAEALVARLQAAGLDAYTDRGRVRDGQPTYRVRLGPESTHEDARALANAVAKATALDPIVLKFP
jgi:cell division septation protein DedD